MWVKLHKSSRTVVAICDENLLGKMFVQGIKQLDIRESFYNGEIMQKEQLISLMKIEFKEGSTFNIVGKESIKTAIQANIIDKTSVKKVKGIPFVLIIN